MKNFYLFMFLLGLILVFLGLIITIQKRPINFKKQSLYDLNGQVVPEKIVKESDIDSGDPDTRYALTGRIVKEPTLSGEQWMTTIQVNNLEYLIGLGKSDYRLGVNEAKNGVPSTTYGTFEVGEVVDKLRKNIPLTVYVVTSYSGNPLNQSGCDQQCKDIVYKIDNQGPRIQELFDEPSQSEGNGVLIEPILQITFATE